MLELALERGGLQAEWIAVDDVLFGGVTAISGRLRGSGDAVCHGCSTIPTVWHLESAWTNRATRAGDSNPKLVDGKHRMTAEHSD